MANVGDIVAGREGKYYRYMGGDTKNKSNWEPVSVQGVSDVREPEPQITDTQSEDRFGKPGTIPETIRQPILEPARTGPVSTTQGSTRGGILSDEMKATLPRFSANRGAGPIKQGVNIAADFLSAPGRRLAASFRPEGETLRESVSKTDSDNLLGSIVRDPALIPSVLAGGPALVAGKAVAARIASPFLKKAVTGATAGAIEGIGSAGIHQAERIGAGQYVDLKSAAGEVVGSSLVGGLAAPVVQGAVKGAKNIAGAIAEEVGTVPLEGLEMWGTKQGRELLKKNWGKELETSKELVDKVFNLKKSLPEGTEVNRIIEGMPDVNPAPVVQALENAKGEITLKTTNKTMVNKIDELIKDFSSGNISAKELRDKRIELDDIIDWNSPGASKLNSLIKQARTAAENILRDNAPEQYKPLMESYAKKLNSISNIKNLIGNKKSSAEQRAFTLIRNVDNQSRQPVKEMLKEFDQTFGTDFTQRAESMHLGRQLGKPGKENIELPLLPKGATGNRWLSVFTGGLGMPRVAAPMLRGMSDISKATDVMAPAVSRGILRPATRTGIGRNNKKEQNQ